MDYRVLIKASDLRADLREAKKKNKWGKDFAKKDYHFEMKEKDKKPLPTVQGLVFRGLVGPNDRSIAFFQCIMTMFQFINTHYVNREAAFDLFIHEELCQVGIDCYIFPNVITYIIWIVDKLLTDKVEDLIANKKQLPAEEIAVFLSFGYHHIDMEDAEKDTCKKWLHFFNDKSIEFRKLEKKGLELASLT
jgi:hypothetical protein